MLPPPYRRFAAESVWLFVAQSGSAIATLVGLRLITGFVAPEVYGTVALALGVVALAHGLTVGPVMQAVLRFFPEVAHDGRTFALYRATLRTLRAPASLATSALTFIGALWAIRNPIDLWLAVLTPALFLAELVRSVAVTFLNAAHHHRELAILMLLDAWARPAAAVALVWLAGPSPSHVLAGYVSGCAFALLAAFRSTSPLGWAVRESPRPLPAAPDLFHHISAYTKPLRFLPLIAWITAQADRYILTAFAGLSAAGVYSALYGLASKPFLLLVATVELTLRQTYYAAVSRRHLAPQRRILGLWIAIVACGALFLWLTLSTLHAPLAALLLAADYRAHSTLIVYISGGYVLAALALTIERVCYAYYDTRGVLIIQAVGAAASLLFTLPLAAYYGLHGAAWAVPLYFAFQLSAAIFRALDIKRRALSTPPEFTPAR